jgi:histidyl-tRNA synthetase
MLESLALYAGVEPDRAGGVYRAIDKLGKIGQSGVVGELEKAGVESSVAKRVVDLVSISGSPDVVLSSVAERLAGIELAQEALRDLDSLFNYLAALGAPAEHYEFDLALARGLEYYTGPVFETTVDEPKIGSLGGAGRYDGLVGMFSGQELPATGMSLGLERIIDVAEELGLLDFGTTVSQVLVTIFDADSVTESLGIASLLRAGGIRTETYLEEGRDLGRQLRFASRRGIPYAVIAGPDERERGVVTVRDMDTGQQVEVARDEVTHFIAEKLYPVS